ncbi:PAS domain S-box protein [Polaribacter atrinae]|uniref:PAS domain S-box protein n=1 Tax=Polaribacter atrinae TaxID=1333662 RepID=UPI0030F66035
MNYTQVAILFLQGALIAFIVLLLFRFRKKLGIGLLLACLGLLQFLQVFISSSVYVSITNNFFVSPGSSILFTVTVFALLIIYIKEDAGETKKVIYTLLIVNILVIVLLKLFGWNLDEISANKPFSVLTNLFDSRVWVLLTGIVALLIDTLLIIVIFEFIARQIRFLFLQIFVTMLLVVSFDTVFFSIIAFWHSDNLGSIIQAGLISKGVFTGFYSLIFYIYLKFFDLSKPLTRVFKIKDVFQRLTYKQKFESAEKVIQETTEMYRILTEHSNDMVFLHEPNNTFRYVSPSIKKLLGYEQSDFIGKQVFSVVHKEDLKFLKEVLTKKMFSKGIVSDAIPLRIRHKQGHFIWLEFSSSPVYEADKISYFVTSARDITQRVLAKNKIEDSLKELEKKEHSLSEASKMAKIGYWEYVIATDTYTWSDYVYQMYGLTPNDGVPPHKEAIKVCDKESLDRLLQATLELNTKGTPYNVVLKLINRKKEEVWVRNVAKPIYNKQNEIIGRRGVLQNITEWKKAQLELELSKQKIQSSLDLLEKKDYSLTESSRVAKIGYWEYDIATDSFTWSDYVYEIYGFSPQDSIPSRKSMVAFYGKDSQAKLEQATADLTLNRIPYDIELKLTNNKNKEVWVRQVVQLIYNEQNEIIGRRGLVHNITAAKNAQIELEISKEKIQTSLKLSRKRKHSMNEASKVAKIGYWEHDMLKGTAVWSDYVHHIFGTNPKDGVLPEVALFKRMNKKSQEKFVEATRNLTANGVSYDLELKFTNLKGQIIWVRNVAQPIYNKQNEIVGKRGVLQNITDSKKVQQELEQSKQKIENTLKLLEKKEYSLRKASEIAKIGYQEYDSLTDTFIWSDHVYDILRFDRNKGVPSREDIRGIFDYASLEKYEKAIQELILNGTPFDHELKFITHNKEEVWVRNVVQPVYNKQNEIIGRRGVFQDITERKQIEKQHLVITERYRNLFDNAAISVWNGDLTAVIEQLDQLRKLKIPNLKIYLEEQPEVLFSILDKVVINKVNKATVKLFKAKSEKDFLDGKIQNTFGSGVHNVFVDFIVSVWNKEKTFTSEVNYKTLKGDEFAALLSIPIPQNLIEQKTVPVSIQSVQSIKDAELEKRESLNRLKEAQELAQVGSWSFKFLTKESEWSDEMFRIWGFNISKTAPEESTILGRVHKEDQEFFKNVLSLAYDKGIPYDVEFRISLPNNVEKTTRSICRPVYSKNGELIGLKGTSQDITEQKRIRKEIEKAEEMYRILTDNSNDLICLQEPDSTFRYISPSIKNLLGYDQLDFLGKQVFSIVHEDDIQELKLAMKEKLFNDFNVEAFSFRVLHKDGHFVWLEFLSSPIYKNNEISYYVTSARDITQWVLAKQKIEEYQTSLQKLTTEMTLIEEKQKKEIATNIHDHLSQSLVISKMKINELKKRPQLKMIDEDLIFIETHISEALENSRKIMYELSPPVLYQLGIIEALNWLFDNVETTHKVACVVNSEVDSVKLDEATSILLYRSIQEVLTNAIKYANASLVTLDLDKNKHGLDIFITDNGIGFNTDILNNLHNHSGSGFGLFTVQERIRNIQGKFTIQSKINTGTTVKIFIPLS